MLRYQENNELHRNFHGSTDNAMRFVEKTCGLDALKEVLRTTGRDVYKSIREKLGRGDASELIEHLCWFYYRENAPFKLEVSENEIRFEVPECPAHKHMKKMGLEPAPFNCLQTEEVNAGMCEGTPWTSTVEHIGPDHCIQIFRKEPSK